MARFKSLRLLAAISLLALSAGTGAGHAARADDYFDMSPEQLLGAEVISASKRPEKFSDVPAAIYVITAEDISRSGLTSIPEVLRMAPGVEVARADSNTWAISIRGLNGALANKLLVMIDGRAVYDPLFGGTYWDIQDMPLSTIDRIEVVRGPGGTLWGANAVNGVINIITKRAADTQGVNISTRFGTDGSQHSVTQGGKAGDAFWRVYGKHSDHKSFDHAGSDDSNHDSWRDSRAGFRGDWGTSFTLQGDLYQNDAQQRFNETSLSAPFTRVVDETMDSHGGNLMAHWNGAFDNGGSASIVSYLDYTYRSQLLGKEVRLISDIEGQYNFPVMGRHALIAGVNYRNTSDEVTGGPTIVLDPRKRSDDLFGLFVQDKIELQPEHWYLTLGSKIEHNDYSGFEYQPSGRLQWLIDPTRSVWAAVSRAVRTPARAEFDFNQTAAVSSGLLPVPVQLVLFANRDFQSEKLTSYELGYREAITPDLAMDAALFYNRFNDLETVDIQAPSLVNNGVDPVHYLLPLQTSNASRADIRGGELALTWRPNRSWKLTGSYSLLDINIFVDDPVLPVNLKGGEGNTPEQQFSVRSYWNVTDALSLDTSLYYVDRLKTPDVKQYMRLDLNLGWQIAPGIKFNLAGQNLLQGEHREFSTAADIDSADIPRTIYGKLTWSF
jgi:iron complex outermembrane receptor protein